MKPRLCDHCRRSFQPGDPRTVYCSTRCAALARWNDSQVAADLIAEREAELSALPRARGCRCIGQAATYFDEGEWRCLDCGRERLMGEVAA